MADMCSLLAAPQLGSAVRCCCLFLSCSWCQLRLHVCPSRLCNPLLHSRRNTLIVGLSARTLTKKVTKL